MTQIIVIIVPSIHLLMCMKTAEKPIMGKVNAESVPLHAMEALGRRGGIAPTHP